MPTNNHLHLPPYLNSADFPKSIINFQGLVPLQMIKLLFEFSVDLRKRLNCFQTAMADDARWLSDPVVTRFMVGLHQLNCFRTNHPLLCTL
jgi:hypothetical protein